MDWKTITLYTRWPFRLSYGVTEYRTVFWLRLTDSCGWGEAAIPPYYGVRDEDMIDLWRKKAHQAKPIPEDISEIPAWVGEEGPAPARCALDMALHDYIACQRGIPLYKLLGVPRPKPVLTTLTIPLASPDEMAAMAANAKAFPRLKVKLGSNDDIGRVAAVREARPDAVLLVDANAGWSTDIAVKQIRRLEKFGLEMVEQPVAKDDFQGLAYVQRHVDVPLIADESICTLEHLEKLAAVGIRAVNLKLMKTGGISNAIKIADIAGIYAVNCMIGCMLESSIGVAAAAHIAVAKSSVITMVDLDTPSLGQYDPVHSGVQFNNSEITITDSPGLGISKIDNLTMLDI